MTTNMIAKLSGLLTISLVAGCMDQAEVTTPAGDEPAPAQPQTLEEGAWVTNPVDTPDGRQVLTYQIVHGRAMFNEDIDLGDALEIANRAKLRGNISTAAAKRWPGAVIPYHITAGTQKSQEFIDAMAEWQARSLFRFVQHTTEHDWVELYYDGTTTVSSSPIGRQGTGAQGLTLGRLSTKATAMHELGHAMGMWHEQARNDRDSYIQLDFGNIPSGRWSQFVTVGTDGRAVWPFDFQSIMLYDSYAFAIDTSKPTMWKVNTHETWTTATTLSAYDLKAAALLALPVNPTPTHLQVSGSSRCITAYPDFDIQGMVYPESCAEWTNEQWYKFPLPGTLHYKLINAYTGFCLQSWFGVGAAMRQVPCTTTNDQLQNFTAHTVDTYYRVLKNDSALTCIDSTGYGLDNPVRGAACNDGPSQKLYEY